MENQNPDGSWSSSGIDPSHPLLLKDNLSSTMACVLALQQWKVGDLLVKRGLEFVGKNSWAINDDHQHTPIGFDIIFPKMAESSMEAGLNLPLETDLINAMSHRRITEIERCRAERKETYLAYVAEGVLSLEMPQDWKEMIMKHQIRNGSLFSSPSTTAAALLVLENENCSNYLHSALQINGNAVSVVHPSEVYSHLLMVDKIQKMGVDHYFIDEIHKVMNATYRCWLQMDEELFSNGAFCAMAFRLLRIHGYEVSSDALVNFDEEGKILGSIDAVLNNTSVMLELHEASQFSVSSKELVHDRIYAWTSSCLKRQLLDGIIQEKTLQKEVDYALTFPYASLDRIKSRMAIEQCDANEIQLLKTSYRYTDEGNNANLLAFAVQDFNNLQALHQREIKHLQMWFKRNKLDRLKFARQAIVYYYFCIMSTVPQHQFSQARLSWVKTVVLTTIVDDFFDFHGSAEAIQNVVELVEKWEHPSSIGFYSEEVRVLFSAIYDMTNDLGARASPLNGWNVKTHFSKLLLDVLTCMKKESEWSRNGLTPTIDEYMPIGCGSSGLAPAIFALFCFMEPKLSQDMVSGQEYKNLLYQTSSIGRLLNDLHGVEREGSESKTINIVSLYVAHGLTKDAEMAIEEIRKVIAVHRRELLRRVLLQTEEDTTPRAYKEVFWKTGKLLHALYLRGDGFSSCPTEMKKAMKAIIHEPLILPPFSV